MGCATDLDALQRIAIALDRPLIVSFGGRDPSEPTTDAGHLAIQELVLRVGRAAGYAGSFELPTRPPSHGDRSMWAWKTLPAAA